MIEPFDNPQLALFGVSVMVGFGLMITATVLVAVQPEAVVPVTVYTVLIVGLAVTVAPVIALSPVVGDQV